MIAPFHLIGYLVLINELCCLPLPYYNKRVFVHVLGSIPSRFLKLFFFSWWMLPMVLFTFLSQNLVMLPPTHSTLLVECTSDVPTYNSIGFILRRVKGFVFCEYIFNSILENGFCRQIVDYCVSFVLLKLILFLNDFIHFLKCSLTLYFSEFYVYRSFCIHEFSKWALQWHFFLSSSSYFSSFIFSTS